MLIYTRTLLLATHTLFLILHVFYTHYKALTFAILNLSILIFYLTIKKKDAKRYIYNFSTRLIKYYNVLVALMLGKKYICDKFIKIVVVFVIFYILSDLLRVFLYEYTQNLFFTKMISPYQTLLMKFEVIMHSLNNMTQVSSSHVEIFRNDANLFKFFMKHYKNDVLDETSLYEILSGSIKLDTTQDVIIPVEKRSDSEHSFISSEIESPILHDNAKSEKNLEPGVIDLLGNLSGFHDLFSDAYGGNADFTVETINEDTLQLNFSPEIITIILRLFRYYDKGCLVKGNFSNYYNQYRKERTNLYNSIKNCYKLFRTYNYTSITFQVIVTVAMFMICLEIQPKILSMFMAIFSFAFFPSMVEIVENFVMLIMNHPFDCGDRIYYKNENYIVSNINLFCSVFEKWNGEFIIINNTLIGKEVIQNVKRSNKMNWTLSVYIHQKTTNQEMKKVITLFKSFCEGFIGKCNVFVVEVQGVYSKYNFVVEHGVNFQNGYFMWRVHNKYTLYLKELLNTCNIEHIMPQMTFDTKE